MREEFVRAYVLHSRPFSDSKLIVEWLTDELGRLSTVARVPSKRNRANFQLFQPNIITYIGRGELKTLSKCEAVSTVYSAMGGTSIKCGMYLNELLLRILHKEDSAPDIFEAYECALENLKRNGSSSSAIETTLRKFELKCLAALGFGIDFNLDVENRSIDSECVYQYEPQSGFIPVKEPRSSPYPCLSGRAIIAMGQNNFNSTDVLRASKLLNRFVLAPLLGSKPLKSRELFR